MAIAKNKKRAVITIDKEILNKMYQVAEMDRRTLSAYIEILMEKDLQENYKDHEFKPLED